MEVQFTVTILILACVQGVISMSPPVVTEDLPQRPPQCGANEAFSVCGNLCEDRCSNRCEAPALQYFSAFHPLENPVCQAGCYCEPGYVRSSDGACVLSTPTVCGPGTNRCGTVSPYAVYQKCLGGAVGACFRRTVAIRPAGFHGRCVCQEGYSMNLKKKCVKSDSKACFAEEDKPSAILYMKTTLDC